MRTTLDIRDEVLEKVKAYAAARSISNGAAISELAERGLKAHVPTRWENGLMVFDPGPEGAVSVEHVMNLKEDLESELW